METRIRIQTSEGLLKKIFFEFEVDAWKDLMKTKTVKPLAEDKDSCWRRYNNW